MKIDLCKIFGVEEGEEFQIIYGDFHSDRVHKIKNNKFYFKNDEGIFLKGTISTDTIEEMTEVIKLPKKKQFTDDELAIMRSLPKEYEWIARDDDNNIYAFGRKPKKEHGIWDNNSRNRDLNIFKHLFQSIQWEDKEPVYIDDYVDR